MPDRSPWHGHPREGVAVAHAEAHEAGPEWCPVCGPLISLPAYKRGTDAARVAALPESESHP